MRRLNFGQLLSRTLARLRRSPLRRSRKRTATPESLEARVLLDANLVKDINPVPSLDGSSPNFLVEINGTVFFTANDGSLGTELWKSDGTSSGTVLVRDIWYGSSSSTTRYLTNVNGTLYFTSNDGSTGYELWKSDGTSSGTVRVLDIRSGTSGSSPFYLTNVNGTLYFQIGRAHF